MDNSQKEIIMSCFDEQKTRRRIWFVVVFNLALVALVYWFGFVQQNITTVTTAFIAYLVVTLMEKIGYGNGVMAYKRIVRQILLDPEEYDLYRRIATDSSIEHR